MLIISGVSKLFNDLYIVAEIFWKSIKKLFIKMQLKYHESLKSILVCSILFVMEVL